MSVHWKDRIGKEPVVNKSFPAGDNVIIWDVINVFSGQVLKISFISKNSLHRQGIRIAVDRGDGVLEVNGVTGKAMDIWEDTAPREVFVTCTTDTGLLSVYNIFEIEGRRYSQTDYSGMIITAEHNKRTYRCNDYGRESGFDKLVFSIEFPD